MIHLYSGDGKGKTTAAMGLALRAAGRGRSVSIAQFLKSENSGERIALAQVPGVTLLPVPERVKFTFAMNEKERQAAAERSEQLCRQAEASGAEVLILDEACAAVNSGFLPLGMLLELLERRPAGSETVLTGRNPPPELVELADYHTEMQCRRHPYHSGTAARRGIEF